MRPRRLLSHPEPLVTFHASKRLELTAVQQTCRGLGFLRGYQPYVRPSEVLLDPLNS
jgi:hypothetical protein